MKVLRGRRYNLKCCDCKFYHEWQGYNDYGNECDLTGWCYFPTNDNCRLVNDDGMTNEEEFDKIKDKI